MTEMKLWQCKLERYFEDALMLMGLFVSDSDKYLFGFDCHHTFEKNPRLFLSSVKEQLENGAVPTEIEYDPEQVILHIARPFQIERIDIFTNHSWMQTVYHTDKGLRAIELMKQSPEVKKEIAEDITKTLTGSLLPFEKGPRPGQLNPISPVRSRKTEAAIQSTIELLEQKYRPNIFQRLFGIKSEIPVEELEQARCPYPTEIEIENHPSISIYFP